MGYGLSLLVLTVPSLALAHPSRTLVPDGKANLGDIIQVQGERQVARQMIRASTDAKPSKVIYLNNNGATLRPGDNDSGSQHSSIVTEATQINGWDIDQDSWNELVGCVQNMYSRWDVTVTDKDPGADVSHIEALIGGSPLDVGLPVNVAGVSPFTTDCGVIPNSIVFTFTDVLDDNPQLICEIVSQEIAHSYGLDHELLAEDPMTYLDYAGPRTFQDEMAHCGEYDQRDCGINGNVCRNMQSSVQMLDARLGTADGTAHAETSTSDLGGCAATSRGSWLIGVGIALFAVSRRRRP